MMCAIRKAEKNDISQIAAVYESCFPREVNHLQWIEASFNSFPKGNYYVLEKEGILVGYILWCFKNGFRGKSIIELEQVGVLKAYAGQGLGKKLIEESYAQFQEHAMQQGFDIGAVIVTTSDGNFAEKLYTSVLGVSRSAVIKGYGSGDEVILFGKKAG